MEGLALRLLAKGTQFIPVSLDVNRYGAKNPCERLCCLELYLDGISPGSRLTLEIRLALERFNEAVVSSNYVVNKIGDGPMRGKAQ